METEEDQGFVQKNHVTYIALHLVVVIVSSFNEYPSCPRAPWHGPLLRQMADVTHQRHLAPSSGCSGRGLTFMADSIIYLAFAHASVNTSLYEPAKEMRWRRRIADPISTCRQFIAVPTCAILLM